MNVTTLNSDIITLLNSINHKLSNMTKNNYSKGNNIRYTEKNTSRCCWTHGACSHDSQCRKKKEIHQDRATFHNKMGGNTLYYPPSTSQEQE